MHNPTRFDATRRHLLLAAAATAASPALAQKRYDPGASDSEIRIGQTMPYSGPVSMLGTIGKTSAAYFEKLNAEGGVNGRKLKLLSVDDGYSPSKTVEGTRRLVEEEEVLLIFGNVGTATNLAIHRYLNTRKVPQLLILSGANRWNDPRNFPFTLSGMLSYQAEARMYARHMLATVKEPKIAVLSQNDDFGRDFVAGLKAQLGERAKALIVAEATYEVTDPTVDSQMVMLKSSGANVFFNFSNGKFTVQSQRRLGDLGWTPQVYLPVGSTSIASVLKPAGVERSIGAVTVASMKNPLDPQWREDAGIKAYYEFMKRWASGLDPEDSLNVTAYSMAITLVEVLRRCGSTLTRENVMRQFLSLKDYATPVMLPGVSITTAADDYEIYGAMRLQRFDGKSWVPFGEPMAR
ncbi:MAG: ABC transporter substrate-binding protein [Burkholderiaceae bacterium]|nr:ABC transporter substrate-binding protein [Burkholderiaceae bacterium]